MSEKILTVVVPSYNVEAYLEETLTSFIHPDIQNLSGCRDLSFRTKKFKKLLTNTSERDNISELLKTTKNIDN